LTPKRLQPGEGDRDRRTIVGVWRDVDACLRVALPAAAQRSLRARTRRGFV